MAYDHLISFNIIYADFHRHIVIINQTRVCWVVWKFLLKLWLWQCYTNVLSIWFIFFLHLNLEGLKLKLDVFRSSSQFSWLFNFCTLNCILSTRHCVKSWLYQWTCAQECFSICLDGKFIIFWKKQLCKHQAPERE